MSLHVMFIKISIPTIILMTTYPFQNLSYQYIISVQLFNHNFQFQLLINYSIEFVYNLYQIHNPIQRSLSPPPAQTMPRQFSPRPEMGQENPVSQSGALRKFMNCGVPVNSSFKTGGYYQSTYIGYDL